MSEQDIRRYSAAELPAMRARGESQTDLARIEATTEEELEQDIAGDPDRKDVPRDWCKAATAVMPKPKRLISLRVDDDLIAFFRQQGPGYQTRINAVLRSYVEHTKGK